MNHFTNRDGYNGIVAASPWLFRAGQPPGGHPFGAYFTVLPLYSPADYTRGKGSPDLRGKGLTMSIGGVDTVLKIPARVRAAEVILRVCLRHWPEGVLEDDSDGSTYPLAEAASRLPSRKEQEFFVYRDAEAAKDWESEGAASSNSNAMLHFLISRPAKETALREVTVVCDRLDEAMQQVLSELATQLKALPEELTR
jgi:hypothetical protein